MNKEFKVQKCNKCGSMIMTFNDCNCENKGIVCCGSEMEVVAPNTVDAAVEKHKPTYVLENGNIVAKVNHVMEEEHYIEWIACVSDSSQDIRYLEPYMDTTVKFDYKPNVKLYAYCNKHGLWSTNVE